MCVSTHVFLLYSWDSWFGVLVLTLQEKPKKAVLTPASAVSDEKKDLRAVVDPVGAIPRIPESSGNSQLPKIDTV